MSGKPGKLTRLAEGRAPPRSDSLERAGRVFQRELLATEGSPWSLIERGLATGLRRVVMNDDA